MPPCPSVSSSNMAIASWYLDIFEVGYVFSLELHYRLLVFGSGIQTPGLDNAGDLKA